MARERIGISSAANLVEVRVSELKQAVREGKEIEGIPVPEPMIFGTGPQYYWHLDEMMTYAAAVKEERRKRKLRQVQPDNNEWI